MTACSGNIILWNFMTYVFIKGNFWVWVSRVRCRELLNRSDQSGWRCTKKRPILILELWTRIFEYGDDVTFKLLALIKNHSRLQLRHLQRLQHFLEHLEMASEVGNERFGHYQNPLEKGWNLKTDSPIDPGTLESNSRT